MLMHWYVDTLICWYISMLVHLYVYTLIHWYVDALVCWYIYMFIRWYVDTLIQVSLWKGGCGVCSLVWQGENLSWSLFRLPFCRHDWLRLRFEFAILCTRVACSSHKSTFAPPDSITVSVVFVQEFDWWGRDIKVSTAWHIGGFASRATPYIDQKIPG